MIPSHTWLLILFVAAGGAAACHPAGGAHGAPGAGLETVLDSTADTVFARVAGGVPAPAIRRLIEELRIAPGVDDTSLFTEVYEFDVDPKGRIWAYDRPSNTIFLFGADGQLIRRIGRQGAGPGEFNNNGGMAVLGDSGLAIWDGRNGRISFLDSAGGFRTSWPLSTGFNTSNAVYTDPSGAIYLRRPVTPPREGEILGRMGLVRLNPGGELGDSLVPPDLPVPREAYLAVNVQGDNRSQSSTSARYAPNYYWAWHPLGWFVVGHGGRYQIILDRPQGKPVVIMRDLPPVPVPAAERDEERAHIIWNMRQTQKDWSWKGPAIPETKAPLMGLTTTRDGRIWARIAAPSERIPEEDLAPPRDPEQPVQHFRTPMVYEVFEADGRFLGRVVFGFRGTLIDADGNTVWAIIRDENDLPRLTRLRIEPGIR